MIRRVKIVIASHVNFPFSSPLSFCIVSVKVKDRLIKFAKNFLFAYQLFWCSEPWKRLFTSRPLNNNLYLNNESVLNFDRGVRNQTSFVLSASL